MRPQDAMAALADGKARVVDVTALAQNPQDPLRSPPAVTEDYQRQVDLG